MDQFILFGDSITQQAFSTSIPEGQRESPGSFGPSLTDAYIRRLDIINRGLSGYNTRQALQVLPTIIPSPGKARVRFITVFFGANDARLPDTQPGPQQHVPLGEFRGNLREIATHPILAAHSGVRIILITPPPVDGRANNRTAEVSARYSDTVRDLGRDLGLPVLDIWKAMMGSGRELSEFLHDGLHLTRTGYDLLFHELMQLIERVWPDQIPERLDFALPKWDDESAWKDDGKSSVL